MCFLIIFYAICILFMLGVYDIIMVHIGIGTFHKIRTIEMEFKGLKHASWDVRLAYLIIRKNIDEILFYEVLQKVGDDNEGDTD